MPRARNTDPSTSHAAALAAEKMANRHKKRIVKALSNSFEGTFYDIAKKTGLAPASVWRRMSELEEDNLAVPTGALEKGPTGRKCRVWSAV